MHETTRIILERYICKIEAAENRETVLRLCDEMREVFFTGPDVKLTAIKEVGFNHLATCSEVGGQPAPDPRDAEIARLREESATWQWAFMRSDEKRRAHQAAVRAHERHGACAETEVARLTQRCEALDDTAAGAQHARDEARAEVARLKEALAAAERQNAQRYDSWQHERVRAEAAEQKLAAAERAVDELVNWACPIARDCGIIGGIATVRRTIEDERRNWDAAEARVRELEEFLDMASDERAPVECECGRIHPFAVLERELKRQGLHVVTEAEMRALEAMGDAPKVDLEFLARPVCGNPPSSWMGKAAVAELARRGEKP